MRQRDLEDMNKVNVANLGFEVKDEGFRY